MTSDPIIWLTVTTASVLGLSILTFATLKGWRDWIDLKRLELERTRDAASPPSSGQRIEVADLKERIRKLEAIAAGVDL